MSICQERFEGRSFFEDKFVESDFDKFRRQQDELISKIKSIGYHSPEYQRFVRVRDELNQILDEVVK